jgi:predicted GNAT superfamily acetyltransferase
MVEIKNLTEISELQKTVEIQKNAWGFNDLDTENHYLMTRVQKYGGLVQGLYLNGEMIGFTFALAGRRGNEFLMYSHMTAVKREFQGRGYGFLLKKAQRQAALDLGCSIIEWNFDPIESLNAFFNFHRLGIISREYERNIYGEGDSGLHSGLPTDRLIACWELNSDRVKHKMKNHDPRLIEDIPEGMIGQFSGETAFVEIPRDIRTIKRQDMRSAIEWRMNTRRQLEQALNSGYEVREVVFSPDQTRIFFRLER